MKPLPFSTDEQWHWRWVQSAGPGATILHRVLSCRLNESEWRLEIVGTVCGLTIWRAFMPGVLSRIGAPRCKRCCKRLGIPAGDGAPFNAKPRIAEPAMIDGKRAGEKARPR